MRAVNSREARGNFSAILNEVEGGREIIITRRGKRVARITPVDDVPVPLTSLETFRKEIKVKGESLSRSVIRQREEERD